jgi:hypothetical protein
MGENSEVGKIGWIDTTVDDAPDLRDFYKAVIGWETDEISMGDYSDYVMKMPSSGDGVSGICHALGSNADLPKDG